jgi:hypothetical protein
MNPNARTYTVEFPGLVLELEAESYPGSGDAEVLGDSRWTFHRSDLERAGLLDPEEPFLHVSTYGDGRTDEAPLLDALAGDRFGYPEDEDERRAWDEAEELESSDVDACIVALRALLERADERRRHEDGAEPWRVRVLWYGECSAFWAFHDITHALEDVDWSGGSAGVYLAGGWAEDRANLEGARRAVRAGVPVGEVLAELAGLRGAFRERFGDESTALADFLDGGNARDDDGEREHAERVRDLAAEVLESLDEDAREEDALERAWEYVDGAAGNLDDEEAARVLVFTSHADRAEEYADGDSTDLAVRAFGALLGDVEEAIGERFEAERCPHCEERRRVQSTATTDDGREVPGIVCAQCARDLEPEELDEYLAASREEAGA